MANNSKDTGAGGVWRIDVDQVSQDFNANTSRVRVRGTLSRKSSNYRSYNKNSISKKISGTNSWSGSGGFDLRNQTSQVLIDQTFTVPHNSDGSKTVSYTCYYGATGTTGMGTPGDISVSLKLGQLSSRPSKPGAPSRTFTAPSTIALAWNAPASNNAAITAYEIRYSTNSNMSGATTANTGTTRSRTITGLAIGRTWYFQVRAYNARGWSDWSASSSYAIPNVPNTPGKPSRAFSAPNSVTVSYSAPANNGAGIVEYQIRYANNSALTGAVTVANGTNLSRRISNLTMGQTWYFQVRARNSQGWSGWSGSATYAIPNVPSAPATPVRTLEPPTSVRVEYLAPATGGAAIVEYRVQWSLNSNFSGTQNISSAGNSLSKTITGLTRGTVVYIRVSARNSQGWGNWSNRTSISIPNYPSAVTISESLYTPPTIVELEWSAPANNGAAISNYRVQYASNTNFTGAKTATINDLYIEITDVSVGSMWYFRVQAYNSQGWGAYGPHVAVLVVCGPRILVGDTWKNTIAYVKVGEDWKTAIPYVNVDGTYKVAGG